MPDDKKREEERVACHVCRAEIPKAAALHAEGREYIHHFCSTGCLLEWENAGDKDESGKA